MELEQKLDTLTRKLYGRPVNQVTDQEMYHVLLQFTKDLAGEKKEIDGEKKVYYISAEFLIGKLLSNNLINLGVYDELEEILNKNGKSIAALENMEPA